MKVLGIFSGPTADSLVEGAQRGWGALEEIADLPESQAQVDVVLAAKSEELFPKLELFKPAIVYVYGSLPAERAGLETRSLGHPETLVGEAGEAVLAAIATLRPFLVYFDAEGCSSYAARLRAAGIPNVIAWSAEAPPKALPAMHFARSFFAALRNPTVSFQEAFAVASHLTQAFASRVDQTTGAVAAPPLPHLLSDAPAGSPGAAGIPPYTGPAAATLNGRPLHEAIPGYASVRLCVPYAEFRFLVAALFGIVNAHCLGNLCQALRALLAAEVRHAVVVKSNPCQKTPPHLPPNSAAVRCDVRTVSGVVISIVFGAPQDVLQDAALVEHAVRQTLTADALTVQLKLPPAGTLMPSMRSAPSVAAGAPLVENLGMTSVWVVHLLKSLCKDPKSRMLAAMGIGAVSATPTASFTKADANRFAAVVTDNDPAELLQGAPAAVNPAVVAGAPAEARTGAPAPAATPAVEGQAPRPPSAIPPTTAAPVVAAPSPSMEPWVSDRGQLASCSEEAFKADVAAFLKARTSKQVDPSTFPDAMLNGSQLDVFALYKEVCARGGYANGNVIDWKEEVFPKMRNYAAGSKVQGVGNALKRHYQQLLLEYEHANSGDVSAGVLGALDNGAAPMET